MRPPLAIARRMRIAVVIGLLMMDAMRSDPGNGAAFEREATANRQKVFEQTRRFVGPMSVQAMIAQTDAEAGGHPIEEDGGCQILPTENEEGRDGSDMEQRHGN